MDGTKSECRICGSAGPHKTYRVREMMFGTREEYRYFQCSNCLCLQIADIPCDLGRYYPSNYYSYHKANTDLVNQRGPLSFLQKQRCRTALFGRGYKVNQLLKGLIKLPSEIEEYGPMIKRANLKGFTDAFLDIGCGEDSWWLEKMRRLGFENLTGIDPLISASHCTTGIPILKKHLEEVDGKFMFISLHHSLEHMVDQSKVMTKVRRLLGPGGVCLVRIPIVSSHAWAHYGVNWVELDAPRHLYLHSLSSIERLALTAGLEIFDVFYDSTEFEFAASEQYIKDIPLTAANSYLINPDESIFTAEQMECFQKEASRVNREKRGGRAGFYLRAIES